MRNKHYLLAILIFITNFAVAQTKNITGNIKTSDGKPAEYVNVSIKETKYKTVTNASGQFEFKNIKKGSYVLITSLIGLESQEISFEVIEGQITTIPEIVLLENSTTLTEVLIQSQKTYLRKPSETVNRLSIKNIENPQSIQVISQELIKDKQIQTVGEAVKLMAGVNSFSASQYSDFTMRGFRTNTGNFAYNGVRGSIFSFDQSALTYNIESIEAIKGPASVLFSAGNPGGVINHITKKAQEKPRYEFQYTIGSFNQHRIVGDATGALSKNKKLLYRFIVGYENTGQLDENLKIKSLFIAPQLQYNFNENTSLTYEFNFIKDNRTMAFLRGTPALYNPSTNDWTLDRYPNYTSLIDPNGTSTKKAFSNELNFKHSFNSNIKLTAIYRGVQTKAFQADLSPGDFAIGATNDSITMQNRSYKEDPYSHQFSSFLNIKFSQNKFIKNNLVVGVDVNVSGRTADLADFEEKRVSVLNPEFGWGYYNQNDINNNLAKASFQTGGKDQNRFWATYIQDQISIGTKFNILLGGRFESHKYEVKYYDLITKEETAKDSVKANQFIPRVGVVYNPNEFTSIYYSYSQGFQPQWGSNGGASGGPFEPEKSRQHEIGFKKELFSQRLITTLAFYQIQKYDVLALDPTDPDGVRMITIDNVYSKGVEFTVQGKISKELDLILNYAYNEAKTPGDAGYDGNFAGWFPNAPNTNVNLWAKYTIKTGLLENLGFGTGFNYLGKRTTLVKDFELPDYTTVDGAISYKIKGLNLSANIYNITNTKYWNGAYSPSNLFPGNPLSFRFTVGYVF